MERALRDFINAAEPPPELLTANYLAALHSITPINPIKSFTGVALRHFSHSRPIIRPFGPPSSEGRLKWSALRAIL